MTRAGGGAPGRYANPLCRLALSAARPQFVLLGLFCVIRCNPAVLLRETPQWVLR